jgi:hypothetical protein
MSLLLYYEYLPFGSIYSLSALVNLTYLCNSFLLYLYGVKVVFFYNFADGRIPWTIDQLVARSLPKHRTTQTQNKHIHIPNTHALCGIRTYDPGFLESEDSTCLRPLGYRDRRSRKSFTEFSIHLNLGFLTSFCIMIFFTFSHLISHLCFINSNRMPQSLDLLCCQSRGYTRCLSSVLVVIGQRAGSVTGSYTQTVSVQLSVWVLDQPLKVHALLPLPHDMFRHHKDHRQVFMLLHVKCYTIFTLIPRYARN